jgi:sortase (surface protein transpeptidase)
MLKNIFLLAAVFFLSISSGTSVLASPLSASVFKTNNLSFTNKNNLKFRYSSLLSSNKKISKNQDIDSKTEPNTSKPESNLAKNSLIFSIPKINIQNQELTLASVANMSDLDQKMLYTPILDTLTSQPCIEKSNTYIMGHSEPATKSSSDKPAVRVFQDLDKLASGDTVEMQNQAGTKCKYSIIGSEIVTTGKGGEVSQGTFNNLYFPQVKDNSILKIQTCVKGSATKRLVVTAVMVG